MRDLNFGNIAEISTGYEIDTLGLVAGAFDEFGLEGLINSAIGKVGSHVVVDSGALVKTLVMQMLNVPYQSLSGTEEYFKNRPIGALLNQNITSEHLGRAVLSRLLDALYEYGGQRLFIDCSAEIVKRLGIKVEEVHIDSTSFHYDGVERHEEGCDLVLTMGYSRDHRPDLIQAVMLMLTDGESRLPVYGHNLSGNIQDKLSFANVARYGIPILKEQYRDLKYLVGDSALCTPDSFREAKNKGFNIITRIPDTYNLVKDSVGSDTADMFPIFPNDENSPLGKWIEDANIDGIPVKALLVRNDALIGTKTETVNRQAQKELKRLESKLKKLRTQPMSTKKDAVKQVEKLIKAAKLCIISDIQYEEVVKQVSKGRPSKNKPAETKVVAVKVTGKIEISQELVDKRIQEEIKYVICTDDIKRDWTMAELLTTYKRNSVIERNWKCLKNPNFFVDYIYLQKPSRIDALLWIMSLALLVYTAMEYRIRKVMKEQSLSIPSIVRGRVETQPTMMRMLQYVSNQHVSLVVTSNGSMYICNLSQELKMILIALGPAWCRYFNTDYYEQVIF